MVQGLSTRLHPSPDTNFLESLEGATSLLNHGCNLLGDDVGLHEGPSVNHSLVFVILMNGMSSGRWLLQVGARTLDVLGRSKGGRVGTFLWAYSRVQTFSDSTSPLSRYPPVHDLPFQKFPKTLATTTVPAIDQKSIGFNPYSSPDPAK